MEAVRFDSRKMTPTLLKCKLSRDDLGPLGDASNTTVQDPKDQYTYSVLTLYITVLILLKARITKTNNSSSTETKLNWKRININKRT